MTNPIVKYNMDRLTGNRDGDLAAVGMAEEMGGNEGFHDGDPCVVANCYMDTELGGLRYFGRNVPEEIERKYEPGAVKIAMDVMGAPKRIVHFICKDLTHGAKRTLQETKDRYNALPERNATESEKRAG